MAALGATLVGGNLNDRGDLAAAITGVDAVASVVPLVTSYDPPEAFDTQLNGIKNIIDAAVEVEVGQFVLFSAHSANRALNRNLANKFQMEEYALVRRSGPLTGRVGASAPAPSFWSGLRKHPANQGPHWRRTARRPLAPGAWATRLSIRSRPRIRGNPATS